MGAGFNPNARRKLLSVAIAIVWLGAAGLAGWSLWPTKPANVTPRGWAYFASEIAVQGIYLDEGRVVLVGIGGMAVVDEDSERRVSVEGLAGEVMIRALAKGVDGRFWIAHQNGLSVENMAGGLAEMQPFTGSTDMLRALTADTSGQLWAGGENGLFIVGGKPVTLPAPNAEVMTLMFDRSGGLWVGTMGDGVMQYSDNTWSHWGVNEGLPHPVVTSFTLNSNGDVWAGVGFYDKGGAVRFMQDGAGWQLAETLSGDALAAPKVRAVFEDNMGRLWFGHEYDGITVRMGDKIIKHVTMADGLPDSEVTTIKQDEAGGIWLGTLKGAAYLTPAAVENLFSENTGENDDT